MKAKSLPVEQVFMTHQTKTDLDIQYKDISACNALCSALQKLDLIERFDANRVENQLNTLMYEKALYAYKVNYIETKEINDKPIKKDRKKRVKRDPSFR